MKTHDRIKKFDTRGNDYSWMMEVEWLWAKRQLITNYSVFLCVTKHQIIN
jgi:hypothetical protein